MHSASCVTLIQALTVIKSLESCLLSGALPPVIVVSKSVIISQNVMMRDTRRQCRNHKIACVGTRPPLQCQRGRRWSQMAFYISSVGSGGRGVFLGFANLFFLSYNLLLNCPRRHLHEFLLFHIYLHLPFDLAKEIIVPGEKEFPMESRKRERSDVYRHFHVIAHCWGLGDLNRGARARCKEPMTGGKGGAW